MDECASNLESKISYSFDKIKELSAMPAWAEQIDVPLVEGNQITLPVRNRFVRDWVKENFLPKLQAELKNIPGEEISLQLVVVAASASTSELCEKTQPPVVVKSSEISKPMTVPARQETAKTLLHETLKPKYNFESFVVGTSNQFAHAASHAVSDMPGRNYNPLFIYGGVGLGKTHLLNAIGIQSLKKHSPLRVIYMSAEKFMNELIQCLRFEKMGEFRKKYRDNCDLLLIDDVQFIAGKERTQDEFFHTFNHLHDLQKQIVLTSDKPPREIPDLEERLRSRFEWGLIADIQVPDLETRMAILMKKADNDKIVLPDQVALFLATHVKSNVRELEGSLIRLHAFACLNKKEISLELAKDVLKNVLGGIDRVLTIEQVQKLVADFFSIKMIDLTGKRRVRSLALPRQIAMYLCRKHTNISYPEIGTKFGGKDHSTVIHAFKKIEKDVVLDSILREQVLSLEQDLTH